MLFYSQCMWYIKRTLNYLSQYRLSFQLKKKAIYFTEALVSASLITCRYNRESHNARAVRKVSFVYFGQLI
jgi:hypothetical protein